MSRRILLLAAAACLAVFQFCPESASASDKKGVALSARIDGAANRVRTLNVRWYYTWGHSPIPGLDSSDFVPMIWGKQSYTERMENLRTRAPVQFLLGFNEPDQRRQANMSVAEVIEKWPEMEKVSARLISPATAHALGPWMRDFMKEAELRKLRIDYVGVHWYGPPDAHRFLHFIDKVYAVYKRPLWITEFAVADWKARERGGNAYSEMEVAWFVQTVLPELERRSHVIRYAWSAAGEVREETRTSALFDENRMLTQVGKIYALFGY